ncbi:hypothetical protein PanWU01x14_184410, partial [Parasponia andersonii]
MAAEWHLKDQMHTLQNPFYSQVFSGNHHGRPCAVTPTMLPSNAHLILFFVAYTATNIAHPALRHTH